MIEQGHPADASRVASELVAREHGALRRVALLVAQGAEPAEVFAAVAAEVNRLVPVDIVHMYRYEPDGTGVAVAEWNSLSEPILEPDARRAPGGNNVRTLVLHSGRTARIDDVEEITGAPAEPARRLGVTCSVGTPIVVGGRLWGVVVSATVEGTEPLPADAEERIGRFTELMAAAIAGAQARAEHTLLADSQAALRRVATLVAAAAAPGEIFAAVAHEVGRLLPAAVTHLVRYEPDASVIVAAWSSGEGDGAVPLGTRLPLEEDSVTDLVRRSGRPARIDGYAGRKGEAADFARRLKVGTTVGSPVVVHGRIWGMIAASSTAEQPLPAEAEARLADFAELVAIAISNAQAWDELAASRARVVAASDETRRRIERNLHDGTQQRLVALALELRGAAADLGDDRGDLRAVLEHTIEGINEVLEEVREISRGLHPAILSEGGLRPALKSLARRSPLPVELELGIPAGERFPAPLEVAVYYLVSEALTNAARHSGGSLVRVAVSSDASELRVTVSDDGSGGASSEAGSGLVGLQDRVEALSGRLTLASPPGLGTTLVAELPLAGASALPASR